MLTCSLGVFRPHANSVIVASTVVTGCDRKQASVTQSLLWKKFCLLTAIYCQSHVSSLIFKTACFKFCIFHPKPWSPCFFSIQLSALQEQPRKDVVDGAPPHTSASCSTSVLEVPSSCPGTPSNQHTKQVGCPSPMGTLKRPTSLSRNPSAAGFPIQSWVFSKGAGKSVIAHSPSPETQETTVSIEVEDIPSLLRLVERFAKAVEKLKDVVLEGKTFKFDMWRLQSSLSIVL